jgi:hypothetical protein
MYERRLLLTLLHETHGKTLLRSHATSGSAGLHQQRKQRREVTESNEHVQNSKKESADLAVGLAALTAENTDLSREGFEPPTTKRDVPVCCFCKTGFEVIVHFEKL